MSPISIAKVAAKLIIGSSTSSVITRVIRQYAASNTSLEEIQVLIAAYTCGAVMSDAAIRWVDSKFDTAVAVVQKLR